MFFLILSCLLYAFNNLIWKKLLSIFNTWLVLVFRALLTSLLALAVALFFYSESLYELQEFAYGRVFLASIFGAFGLICMVLALKRGSLFQLGIFNSDELVVCVCVCACVCVPASVCTHVVLVLLD